MDLRNPLCIVYELPAAALSLRGTPRESLIAGKYYLVDLAQRALSLAFTDRPSALA